MPYRWVSIVSMEWVFAPSAGVQMPIFAGSIALDVALCMADGGLAPVQALDGCTCLHIYG